MIATQSRGGLLGVLAIFGLFAMKIRSKLVLSGLIVIVPLILFS